MDPEMMKQMIQSMFKNEFQKMQEQYSPPTSSKKVEGEQPNGQVQSDAGPRKIYGVDGKPKQLEYKPAPLNMGVDVIVDASRLTKIALSSLQFDDVASAIKNLKSALAILEANQ